MGQDYIEKIVLIQTQFGHASIKSTEQYTHLSAAMFSKMREGKLKARFEEAQDIYLKTYLPPKAFADKRGRPRKAVAP
jgi:integrase/recombinase XerD